MRQIKFRGISKKTGKFIYGIPNYEFTHIFNAEQFDSPDNYEVKTETIGQFTGLQDKNGVDVYEGDLLRFPPKNKWEEENYSFFEVFFHDGDANSDYNIGYSMNRMHNHGTICGGWIPSFKPGQLSKMIVIGKIYKTQNS